MRNSKLILAFSMLPSRKFVRLSFTVRLPLRLSPNKNWWRKQETNLQDLSRVCCVYASRVGARAQHRMSKNDKTFISASPRKSEKRFIFLRCFSVKLQGDIATALVGIEPTNTYYLGVCTLQRSGRGEFIIAVQKSIWCISRAFKERRDCLFV